MSIEVVLIHFPVPGSNMNHETYFHDVRTNSPALLQFLLICVKSFLFENRLLMQLVW
jgi:hypothetical protein